VISSIIKIMEEITSSRCTFYEWKMKLIKNISWFFIEKLTILGTEDLAFI